MGEMMNEAVDAAMDNNDLEEETDEEVAKVLDEILAGKRKSKETLIGFGYFFFIVGKVGQLPSVVAGEKEIAVAAAAVDVDSEEDEMERRLQALRS